jgi:hypothetical protein
MKRDASLRAPVLIVIASGLFSTMLGCSGGSTSTVDNAVSGSVPTVPDDAVPGATGVDGDGAADAAAPPSEPCSGTICSAPPATACLDASTLRTYAA